MMNISIYLSNESHNQPTLQKYSMYSLTITIWNWQYVLNEIYVRFSIDHFGKAILDCIAKRN